jgi:cell division protein FtsB
MKKNAAVKIMAILAMLWIVVSIVWTGLLIIFGESQNQTIELTQEDIEAIQQQIDSMTGSTQSGSELEITDITTTVE